MLSASKIGISRTPVQETSIKAEGGMVEIKGEEGDVVSHVLGRAGVTGTEFHGVQESLAKQLEKSKPEGKPSQARSLL